MKLFIYCASYILLVLWYLLHIILYIDHLRLLSSFICLVENIYNPIHKYIVIIESFPLFLCVYVRAIKSTTHRTLKIFDDCPKPLLMHQRYRILIFCESIEILINNDKSSSSNIHFIHRELRKILAMSTNTSSHRKQAKNCFSILFVILIVL